MTRHILPAATAMLLLAGTAAMAQGNSDTQTRDLIERLSPTPEQTQQMRGIRMPAADSGTVAPVLVPAAPAAASPVPVPMPAAPPMAAPPATPALAPAQIPSPPPRVAAGTTAPAGMAAASITVNFTPGSHALSPQAVAGLAALGRALASPELSAFRFRIEGHTDTMGDAASNMALSQRRAEAVREFLLGGFPIAPFRLIAVGFGEGQLLVPTADQRDEPRNRRVQVVNLGG